MSKVLVVVGGQFGSEAKGHVSAKLARRELDNGRRPVAVRVAGPNAGHTAYDRQGRAFALRTIPAMAVVDPTIPLVLAAGSEIQVSVLLDEIELLESAGHPVKERLWIDPQATVLSQDHIDEETDATMHERLGSTGKGVGAARAARLMRKAQTWQSYVDFNGDLGLLPPVNVTHKYMEWHDSGGQTIILEGTQGYGLGLHAGFYPYCTSSDCRSIDFLAMAGIDPRAAWVSQCETWIVCRTYPIRVAGQSGPLYNELTWEKLAERSNGYIKPELTTVTRKTRRIGEWDADLVMNAVYANGGPDVCKIALTFLDYIDPSMANARHPSELTDLARRWLEANVWPLGTALGLITTGPDTGFFTGGML